MSKAIPCRFCFAGALIVMVLASPLHAENSLFPFAEMRRLQDLAAGADERRLVGDDALLFQNMEFYAVSVFEGLLAASNAAKAIHGEPLFCAPKVVFEFREEGDIAKLALYLSNELLMFTSELGGEPDRYDDRPAAEALLLGLRTAFPCDPDGPTMSAMR